MQDQSFLQELALEVRQELIQLKELIREQSLLQKEVLNFKEACQYLGVSQSHLYKLTSTKSISFFCPQGKRLYFKRNELDSWLLRNRTASQNEIDQQAGDYLIKKGRVKLGKIGTFLCQKRQISKIYGMVCSNTTPWVYR